MANHDDDPERHADPFPISVRASIAQAKARQIAHQRTQNHIALIVMILYGVVIGLSFCLLFYKLVFMIPCATGSETGCTAWKEPADYLFRLISTAVIPIVTLVLGYYFGSESRS